MKKDCIICCDKIEIQNITYLSCGHPYHNECIINLVKKRIRKCPECRTKITWNVNQLITHQKLYISSNETNQNQNYNP